MKACIFGAGAIGGWIAHRLAHAGCSVSVVARGTTLDALQLHGLLLHEGKAITSKAVASTDTPAELNVQDLVVLAVKAPSLPEVARQIDPLIGPGTIVMTAMNGVPWWFLQGFGGALAGTRVMAWPAPHFAVADGHPDRAFIYLNLLITPGRSAAMVQRAGEAVLASCKAHLAPVFAKHAVGLTLQIHEGAPVYEGKHNNLAAHLTPS